MNKSIILVPFAYIIMISCLRDPGPIIGDLTDSYISGPGVYILNEGNFRSGNGSLSFYSYDSAKIFNNIFLTINERPLGDVPYSMNILGDKAYIVVNNSGKIEVVNRNDLKSVKTINGLISPRYISFISSNKAYVTSLYSDSVSILDLSANVISGYINIGRPSEAIMTSFDKSFVAHWTGGNKILVINTLNNQVVDSVEVGIEPESMVLDKNNMLWVLCNGGWTRDNYAELIGINTQTNTVEKRFTFPSKTDSPTCLQIDGKGETLYYLQNGVKRMSISSTQLPPEPFIAESDRLFYKVGINPENGEIFITDVVDYLQKGYVLRYKNNGTLVSVMQAEIIPGAMCFKVNPDYQTE